MTQPKPVDQQNQTQQRVVLLATDSSRSIIAEVADGTANSIGYSAYGEQSAQQQSRRNWASTANCVSRKSAGICWATAIALTTRD